MTRLLVDAPQRPATLVMAIGNPSRGDDAAGPWLAERLADWLQGDGRPHQDDIEVICEQQLMVEHALDLAGRTRVLFIDAAAQQDALVCWQPIQPATSGPSLSSHQCTPAQLLQLCLHTLREPAPPSWLLSLRGAAFELGAPMSTSLQAALQQVWLPLLAWLTQAPDSPHHA